ncbi:HBR398Wp [Eremothecium sinecaudum]|uniref:HBR398Wp n=1 Tax=Eremothecium sinecaudum TaxID=45286 RepID=A0A109UXH3_9SACH|nr:HBR398Wp [Eremothecium sinecaudum]AMD19299.1 HBR398Wp [Eremothecium sinecaudum]
MSTRKKEYIAKVNYKNDLPPPPLPPKLLKYNYFDNEAVESPQLITSLYTKTNVTPLIQLDKELGMPIDLIQIPGVLNQQDTKFLYGYDSVKLQQEDRVLLRDPRVDRITKTDLSKVTFLRRTEYMSSTLATKNEKKRPASTVDDDGDSALTPSQIVEKVENTFDTVGSDLSKLSHPNKKNVKAVKTWSLLPDTVSMDQTFFTIKMVGSAALNKKEKDTVDMTSAIFRPVELEEDEWVSAYVTDSKNSEELRKELEQQIDELSENNNIYKYRRLNDYDMKQMQPSGSAGLVSEVVISFNDDKGVAYYKPLRSRLELRKRRVNDVIKPLVRENNWDQINLKLRKPTTQETKLRDKIRMRFDPIDFPNVDDDDVVDDSDVKPVDETPVEGTEKVDHAAEAIKHDQNDEQ